MDTSKPAEFGIEWVVWEMRLLNRCEFGEALTEEEIDQAIASRLYLLLEEDKEMDRMMKEAIAAKHRLAIGRGEGGERIRVSF